MSIDEFCEDADVHCWVRADLNKSKANEARLREALALLVDVPTDIASVIDARQNAKRVLEETQP